MLHGPRWLNEGDSGGLPPLRHCACAIIDHWVVREEVPLAYLIEQGASAANRGSRVGWPGSWLRTGAGIPRGLLRWDVTIWGWVGGIMPYSA